MDNQQAPVRKKIFQLRLSDGEREKLRTAAAKADLSASEFLRDYIKSLDN